jgi:hypothetical protein
MTDMLEPTRYGDAIWLEPFPMAWSFRHDMIAADAIHAVIAEQLSAEFAR